MCDVFLVVQLLKNDIDMELLFIITAHSFLDFIRLLFSLPDVKGQELELPEQQTLSGSIGELFWVPEATRWNQ